MRGTPVLHFSGRFRFDMPEYNNDPVNARVRFDPSRPRDEVIALCGCNPSRYFEFRFEEVYATQVTYLDGLTDCDSDPVMGQPVKLKGFLVDVSPSSINARLFAGRLRVGRALAGRLDVADQSDECLNIRPLGLTDETAAAHYQTRVVLHKNPPLSGSRYFSELGTPDELEIYFQLNRWTTLEDTSAPQGERLSGDVYGYLRPRPPAADPDGLRLLSRPLITHPQLDYELIEFVVSPFPSVSDIEGTYDLLREEGLVALRYLDFIPFLDRDRRTPDVDYYQVSLQDDGGTERLDLGRFDGDLAEMRRCGGLVHHVLPEGVDVDSRRLVVEAVKDGGRPLPLMQESEWNLQLVPPTGSNQERALTPRGVILPFGGSVEVRVQVLRRNRPAPGQTVRWDKPVSNGRSPLVDSFGATTGTTGADGVAAVSLQAQDIRKGPPRSHACTSENLAKFPLDRFYGNRVVAEIDHPGRRLSGGIEQVKIAVRVLHEFRPEDMPDVPSFERDIRPLFSSQTRYFPWLFVREVGTGFQRFLDVDNIVDFRRKVDQILHRIELDPNDPHKLPRSRDLPFGAADLIRKWKDTGMSP